MTEASFETLLKPDRYQVFLFCTRPSLPLSFAAHPWFVINKKGVISRWEVIASPHLLKAHTLWGHICLNVLPPLGGLRVLRSLHGVHWPVRLLGIVEGAEGSVAARMAESIERSPQTYPYRERYAYQGPNSNTYVQWVSDQFPEAGFTLPWNAFGKKFPIQTAGTFTAGEV